MSKLPANLDAERLILGVLLTDQSAVPQVLGAMEANDFSLESHRRIYHRINDLYSAGERIDRLMLVSALDAENQLESVGGLSYIISLDDGLPEIYHLEGYIRIVRETATLRRLAFLSQSIIDRVMARAPLQEVLDTADASIRGIKAANTKRHLTRFSEFLEGHGYDDFMSARRAQPTVPFPWPRVADLLGGGLRPGELVLVAGRPSHGKSVVAGQLCHHAASAGKAAALFSLEMGSADIWYRIIAGDARVSYQKWRKQYCTSGETASIQESMARLADLPLWVDDQPANCTVSAVEASVRQHIAAGNPCDLVVIDYLQLMSTIGRHTNRVQEITEISRGLKLLAKDLDVPIVALSQLSRYPDLESKSPNLQSLRDSGSLEQDADIVIFVWQRESERKAAADENRPCQTLMDVRKQRNGPLGSEVVWLTGRYLRLDESLESGREQMSLHGDEI